MEELDLMELFNIFWSKKLQVILIVLIFMIIGVIYTTGFTSPVYSSYTTLVLASSGGTSDKANTITASDITVNSQLVSTYSELVRSDRVLKRVVSNLDIKNINEEVIKNNVKVSSRTNTEIIEISVTNENPENAAKIANEIANVFIENVKEIYHIENIQVVDQAKVDTTPSNINHKKDVVIFACIGLVIAIGYVLVANMLDTTIKTAEELEDKFDLTVLAAIPVCNTEAKKKKGGKR